MFHSGKRHSIERRKLELVLRDDEHDGAHRASASISMPAGPSSPAPARERLSVVGADVTDGTGRGEGVIRPRMSTVPGAAEAIAYWLFIGNSPVGA
jgi:hypothetical protein